MVVLIQLKVVRYNVGIHNIRANFEGNNKQEPLLKYAK